MKKFYLKVFQPIIVLIIMFLTLNSFRTEEDWEDIFLRGTWEEIDRSVVSDQHSVFAGYADKQVMVSTSSKHSDMTIRLFTDGVLVSETLMLASSFITVIPLPVADGQGCEIQITSKYGGYLSGNFVAE